MHAIVVVVVIVVVVFTINSMYRAMAQRWLLFEATQWVMLQPLQDSRHVGGYQRGYVMGFGVI